MAESDIRKTERLEKARKHGETSGHKATHGHAHHSRKEAPEHSHQNEHQHDQKKRRMNMKARLVPVLIALATISVITIDARAAIAGIGNPRTISTAAKITQVKIAAPTIRANRIQIEDRIDERIGSADEIDNANITGGGIAIAAGTIDILDNSIRAIDPNNINNIGNVRKNNDGNDLNQ